MGKIQAHTWGWGVGGGAVGGGGVGGVGAGEESLKKERATHSSILVWKIP